MPRAKKGERFGGRQKGTPNKATAAREELARAQLAASLRRAKAAGKADPRVAIDELYEAIAIAKGFAGTVQPIARRDDQTGKVSFQGGDVKLFGEWFDRFKGCIDTLIKYQLPPMKAVDAPTPPPDPTDLERQSRKRFGLRIFDGGRQINGEKKDG